MTPFQLSDLRLWECPEVSAIHKLPPRATHELFPGTAADGGDAAEASPWHRSLDGAWSFRLAPDPATALRWVGGDASGAPPEEPIRVPGNWELQGWGRPHYTNVQMPWPEEPPTVPRDNPTGIYRRSFTVPRAWRKGRMVVRFGSADSVLIVFCNGRFVGLSKDSRLPAEFDLTGHLSRSGPQELSAVVVKWSDASHVEDQDMWWLAGLPRSVSLLRTPRLWIDDVRAIPRLHDDGTAELEVTVRLGHAHPVGQLPADCAVACRLLDPKGRRIGRAPTRARVSFARCPTDHGRARAFLRLQVPASRLQRWSAETPVRYTLQVELPDAPEPCHTTLKVGFRSVEVRQRDLLINGRRVLLKGVNRHEHDERHGKALTREHMRRDIVLMKQLNFNAVRCAHYPPDPTWLDLCDEYGLYVIDEANLESHAFHNQLCHDPRYATTWLDRVMRMVIRDQNHPSIVLWSLGNESGYGPNHDGAAGWVRGYDDSRPLHYEGAISKWQSHLSFADGGRVTDVICPMYPEIEDLVAWSRLVDERPSTPMPEDVTEEAIAAAASLAPLRPHHLPPPLPHRALDAFERPVILCEYSHAMGNSNGSLADYFEAFRRLPGLQGGFIWEWADHGLLQTDSAGRPFHAYGGDFGDTPNDANFVCDGIVGPDRTPHPAAWEHKHLAQPIAIEPVDVERGVIRIRNVHDFLTLAPYRGRWETLEDGLPAGRGALPRLTLAPGEAKEATLPLPAPANASAERLLTIRFFTRRETPWAPPGHEIAWQQFTLPSAGTEGTDRRAPASPRAKVEADVSDEWIHLSTGEVEVRFDRGIGRLCSLRHAGVERIARGPELQIWRAATDNDGIKLWSGQDNKPLGRLQQLGLPNLAHRLLRCTVRRSRDGSVEVRCEHAASGRGQWGDATHRHHYRLRPDGRLELSSEVVLGAEDMTDLPRVGLRLDLPPSFSHLNYYGLGPWETYPDRQAAGVLGRFSFELDEERPPYVMPQEFGHRTATRWIEAQTPDGAALRITGGEPFGFNASRFTAEDLFAARHLTELTPRPEGILYLDAAHRGLGTASCGPDTLERYRLRARRYRWSLTLESFASER